MQIKSEQSSSTMLHMKHIFPRMTYHTPFMSAKAQEHVRSSFEAFLRMQDLQEYVLEQPLFQKI